MHACVGDESHVAALSTAMIDARYMLTMTAWNGLQRKLRSQCRGACLAADAAAGAETTLYRLPLRTVASQLCNTASQLRTVPASDAIGLAAALCVLQPACALHLWPQSGVAHIMSSDMHAAHCAHACHNRWQRVHAHDHAAYWRKEAHRGVPQIIRLLPEPMPATQGQQRMFGCACSACAATAGYLCTDQFGDNGLC